MFYLDKPPGFNPKTDVVSCFLEYRETFLLLLRQGYKSEGNTWGMPAGRVEADEHRNQAVVHEVREETGIALGETNVIFLKETYVRYPEFDFTFHVYKASFSSRPHIHINKTEHKRYQWVTPAEALDLVLIRDEDAVIKHFYHI